MLLAGALLRGVRRDVSSAAPARARAAGPALSSHNTKLAKLHNSTIFNTRA